MQALTAITCTHKALRNSLTDLSLRMCHECVFRRHCGAVRDSAAGYNFHIISYCNLSIGSLNRAVSAFLSTSQVGRRA